MWDWIKTLFGAVTPVAALREQISLLKAQLAEAHSLIERQTAQIADLTAQNKELYKQAEELKRIQSEAFKKPLNIDRRGIV